ncbi:protein DD3-3-like [Elysia marginata]|uniref:Protein DD3-3-like n=1 Tax=Elysia marginata TaxID=1093978 RepID=A0AAV4GTR5_9GAST|nr:protein DD3-3-like [Elysia marginata]
MAALGRAVGGAITCLLLLGGVVADIYFHVPRGANNRLDETTANRRNANRLYDSQNNNRGGYNVGDKTDTPFKDDYKKQYYMKYFQSSEYNSFTDDQGKSFMNIEWTNQHGSTKDTLRNGVSTATQRFRKPSRRSANRIEQRKNDDVKMSLGLHESWDWYNKCYLRERNNGLFTADQKLRKNRLGYSSAIYTRQNNAGTRRGYECPEERDYYPYWHPNPWIDVAVMVDSLSMCSSYQAKSFNVQPYNECIHPDGWSRYTNEKDCTDKGGQWLLLHSYIEKATDKTTQNTCESATSADHVYTWAVAHDSTNGYQPECLVQAAAPDCLVAPWTRSNHNGNTDQGGETSSYLWTLPHFPSGKDKRCALRIRYNISTADYDPDTTDSSSNQRGVKYTQNADGEGRQGTDRSNVVEMLVRKGNFPLAFEDSTSGLWDAVEVVWIYHGQKNLPKSDLAINMASSGYYQCSQRQTCGDESVDAKEELNEVLNNAPASYEGVVLRFTKQGTFHFMSTRNNNFSNRSQKAAIVVE